MRTPTTITSGEVAAMSTEIIPFRIEIPEADLDDLRERLRRTRWPDAETVDDGSQGVRLSYLRDLCEYWLERYDWRACEASLNRFPQFRTSIDGLGIHFLHVRSPQAGALPLIMTHGWPGSIVEFRKVIGPLPTRLHTAGTPPTRSTWCARRCRDSASVASPHGPAGVSSESPMPGMS